MAAVKLDPLAYIEKIETVVNKYFERKDIAKDIVDDLRELKFVYDGLRDTIQVLYPLVSFLNPALQNYFRMHNRTVERNLQTLVSLEADISVANRTKRVRRLKQLLEDCEEKAKEIAEFLVKLVEDVEKKIAKSDDKYSFDNNVPSNPPRLTLDYSTTSTFEGQMKASVLEEGGSKIIGVVAYGQGGVGKTCALRGLAQDQDIQDRFRGGTLYVELGMRATVLTIMRGIATIVKRTGGLSLSRKLEGATTLQEAVDDASIWFRPHTCLFLIDDIWHARGINSSVLRTLGTMVNDRSRLVYTTRDKYFLSRCDMVIPFSEHETHGALARRMLLTHGGFDWKKKLNDKNEAAVRGILGFCQGLALPIGVAGETVREEGQGRQDEIENTWGDFYARLKSKRESIIEGDMEGYGGVKLIVDYSLEVLDSERGDGSFERMFRALCVLEKQQMVPIEMLRHLWGLEDLKETKHIVDKLDEVSVVRKLIFDGPKIFVQLHDTILDIAIRKASDRYEVKKVFRTLMDNYSEEERKRGGTTVAGSTLEVVVPQPDVQRRVRLAKRMRKLCSLKFSRTGRGSGRLSEETVGEAAERKKPILEWWNSENDGYIHDNLCRVLLRAGYKEALLLLLSKPQWIVSRLQNSGIFAVERDLEFGKLVAADASGRDEKLLKHLEVVGKAARMGCTYVNDNRREAWFQIHGRLLWYADVEQCERTKRFLREIEECAPRPWAKASIGFLQQAGTAAADIVPCSGRIASVQVAEERLAFVWINGRTIGLTQYTFASGASETQTCDTLNELSSEHERDDPVFEELSDVFVSGEQSESLFSGEESGGFVSREESDGFVSREENDDSCYSEGNHGIASGEETDDFSRLESYVCLCASTMVIVFLISFFCTVSDSLLSIVEFLSCMILAVGIVVSSGIIAQDFVYVKENEDLVSEQEINEFGSSEDSLVVGSGAENEDFGSSVGNFDLVSGEQNDDLGSSEDDHVVRSRTWTDDFGSSEDNHVVRSWKGKDDFGSSEGNHVIRSWKWKDDFGSSEDNHKLSSVIVSDDFGHSEANHVSAEEKEDLAHSEEYHEVASGEGNDDFAHLDKIASSEENYGSEYSEGNHDVVRSEETADSEFSEQSQEVVSQDDSTTSTEERDSIGYPNCGALSNDFKKVAIGLTDGSVLMWDTETGHTKRSEERHNDEIVCVALSADGNRVVSGSEDGAVWVWEVGTGEAVRRAFVGRAKAVQSVTWSADQGRVLCGLADRTVRIGEVGSGEFVGTPLVGHTERVTCVAWSKDEKRVASGSDDKTVRLWDVESGEQLGAALVGHTDRVRCVAWSADEKRVVSGSEDRTVRAWEVPSGKLVGPPLVGHTNWVDCVAWSPNGRRVVSASRDKTVRVWEIRSGEGVEAPLVGHTDWVQCVAGTADGRRVATGSWDKTVRVWDVQSGEPVLAPFVGHTETVGCVAWSADGRRVVSGSWDKTVRVWDVGSGEAVGSALVHDDEVKRVEMNEDGSRVVSRDWSGVERVWRMAEGEWVVTSRGDEWGEPLCRWGSSERTSIEWGSQAVSADWSQDVLGTCENVVGRFGDTWFSRANFCHCRVEEEH